jgi:TM2 domain-containing membrane protein YozV
MATVPLFPPIPDEQQPAFQAQLALALKDEVAGVLLALFLGSFGAHHFYLRRTALGVIYLLLFWTGLPGIAGIIEAFLMPGRVARYNLAQTAAISELFRSGPPAALFATLQSNPLHRPSCPACGTPFSPGVRFCARCGALLAP